MPWRGAGVALLCVAIGLATAGAAAPSRDSTAAPSGQVWALALPSSVKTVSQAQVNWLASKGVTAIVASKLPPKSLRQLTASARRAKRGRDRTPAGGAQDRLQVDRRDASDMCRTCGNAHSRRQACATLPRRLRDRACAQPAGAADAPWQRRRPQSDRRPPAGGQDGGLACRHRLCRRRPCSRSRRQLVTCGARQAQRLSLVAATREEHEGRLSGADGSTGDGVLRPHQDDRLARLEGRTRQRPRRRLPALPERRQRRSQGNSRLHLQGAQVRDQIHIRARRIRRGRKHLYPRGGDGLDVDRGVHRWIASDATPDLTAGCRRDDPTRPVVAERLQRGGGEQQLERGRRQPRRAEPLGQQEGRPSSAPAGQSSASSMSTPRTSRWTTSTSTATRPKVTILDNGGDNNIYKNLEIRNNTDVQMITNPARLQPTTTCSSTTRS